MNRRNFAKLLVGIGAAASTGYVAFTDFYDIVDKIVRKELSYLPISDDVYDSFITDVRRERAINHFGTKKELFAQIHFMSGDSLGSILPYRYKYEQYQNDIIANFLLSTDFFQNKMDETELIRYVGLFHPYKRACSNPFSSIYYQYL